MLTLFATYVEMTGDEQLLLTHFGKAKALGEWLLNRVATHAKGDANWKGYEIPRDIILDHDEWTTDNGLLTPTMKVKLRNLLTRHEDAIAALD